MVHLPARVWLHQVWPQRIDIVLHKHKWHHKVRGRDVEKAIIHVCAGLSAQKGQRQRHVPPGFYASVERKKFVVPQQPSSPRTSCPDRWGCACSQLHQDSVGIAVYRYISPYTRPQRSLPCLRNEGSRAPTTCPCSETGHAPIVIISMTMCSNRTVNKANKVCPSGVAVLSDSIWRARLRMRTANLTSPQFSRPTNIVKGYR